MKYKKTVFYILFLFFSTTFSQQLSEIVDTRIGTKGESLACGYSFIGATYPFGMVQFTPSFFSPQKGLSSMLFRLDRKSVFIEPYSTDLTSYAVYSRKTEEVTQHTFECLTDDIALDMKKIKQSNNNYVDLYLRN